jgi:hypothetical protein
MANPPNGSDHMLRSTAWKEIRDITECFRGLNCNGTIVPLTIDNNIRPVLPTSEECVRSFMAGKLRRMPSSWMSTLKNRIDRLREKVLLSYDETMKYMTPLAGLEDSEVQRKHSRSLEAWFEQAIDELFAVHMAQLEVSTSSMTWPNLC